MTSVNFIEQQNIELIWDILLDMEKEFIMKNNGKYANAVKSNFMNIIKNFYEHEKKSSFSLIEMNKKIISLLINEWIPMLKKQEQEIRTQQQKPVEKENILFTAEEIQINRKSQFDKDLSLKENEFRNAMTQQVPSTIDFNEKKDEPIGEMEKLIAETIAQRNFEINQIQNANKNDTEKWLKSEKTNPKSESEIKYIKIGDPIISNPPVVELTNSKKQLSWAPKIETEDKIFDSDSESIFKKLKPITKESIEFTKMNEKMDTLLGKMDTLINILLQKEG